MNKKLEIKYTALKDDLLKLEKDTTETINSQIEELAVIVNPKLSHIINLKMSHLSMC